jgi:hypothetical protein
MSKDKTKAGSMDHDATEGAKENKKKKEEQLKKIFSDNKSKRYSGPIDA